MLSRLRCLQARVAGLPSTQGGLLFHHGWRSLRRAVNFAGQSRLCHMARGEQALPKQNMMLSQTTQDPTPMPVHSPDAPRHTCVRPGSLLPPGLPLQLLRPSSRFMEGKVHDIMRPVNLMST